jgi:hypothetical protein
MTRNTQPTSIVLSLAEIDTVAGGVTQRPDGSSCTDPISPMPPLWPFGPITTTVTLEPNYN